MSPIEIPIPIPIPIPIDVYGEDKGKIWARAKAREKG